MDDQPIYTSESTVKSLWQTYHVYEDHLAFDTLFGRMNIPFDNIERATVSESDVKGLLKGDLGLTNFRPALKLDWANFLEHIVVDKHKGTIRRILFTPKDPHAFNAALHDAMAQYRQRQGGSEDRVHNEQDGT
jgi:hypothetical protein